MRDKVKLFFLILLILSSNFLFAQNNYLTISSFINDETILLLSNNNGRDISKQNINLNFNDVFTIKKNSDYNISYYISINDNKGFDLNQIGLKISKNDNYFISLGKIIDSDYYLPKQTSGSMLFSRNYEPIPEIKFGINKKKIFKKLRFSALISHGFLDKNEDFYERPYLHHKYLFIDIGNFKNEKFFSFGLHHAAVWGGATTIYDYGDLGRSTSDWLNVVLAKHGNSVNINGPQGNHLGILHFSYKFLRNSSNYIYYQKFWEDGGSLWHTHSPIWDGLYGYNYSKGNRSFTIEYLKTTYQSGNFHPNGIDSYYWHIPYTFGWEYKNFTIGNFQISKDSNRVESIYFAFSDQIRTNFKLTVILNILNRHSIAYQDKGWNEEIDLSNDTYTTYKMGKFRLDFFTKKNPKINYFIETGIDMFLDDKNIGHHLGMTYNFNL